MKTIFVSIPNYRDSEINPTISSLLTNADNSNRVRIGVLSQINKQTDNNCIALTDSKVDQIIVPYNESKGCSWARGVIQKELMGNEDYYFQIDSHSRFVKGWDTRLIELLDSIGPNAALSTYPVGYDLPDRLQEQRYIWLRCINTFKEGMPSLSSLAKSFKDAPHKPELNAFIAGGFYFTTMDVAKRVLCDPHIYFLGEEIMFAVRLYTHGVDVYTPNIPIMWHKYHVGGNKNLHWKDNKDYYLIDNKSKERIYHLLNIRNSNNHQALLELDTYGLGNIRTIKQYQVYAGYYFKTGTIEQWCKDGKVLKT